MENKRPKGISILCISLFLISILVLGLLLCVYILRISTVNLPNASKMALIQGEQYKRLHVNSIKEFDVFWKNFCNPIFDKTKWDLLIDSVAVLILAIGLWYLINLARIGLIIVLFARIGQTLVNSVIYKHPPHLLEIIVFGLIIYYLTRPKVKEQFK